MKKKSRIPIQVKNTGQINLPAEIADQYDLSPGTHIELELTENGIIIHHHRQRITRIYIEPTNRCNLNCSTCMRNVWDEPLGLMTHTTFDKILRDAAKLTAPPDIFFGGFGEPLSHPAILSMVERAKKIGGAVELITNGILLSKEICNGIIEAGLDRLWVSIDGANPASYEDVRLGDELPLVLENLQTLKHLKETRSSPIPRLGIAFVAMRRNVGDLPEVVAIGKRLGADKFSISNVLPHTSELRDQILYERALSDSDFEPSIGSPEISLPRMDINLQPLEIITGLLHNRNTLQIAGKNLSLGTNHCPFVNKGSISIRWDGLVSPCLPLLHSHVSYLGDTFRKSSAYHLADINKLNLANIWHLPAYAALRERLREFDFSPCVLCNSCGMAEGNLEDCFGNVQPACGGCLWAQGFIQCP